MENNDHLIIEIGGVNVEFDSQSIGKKITCSNNHQLFLNNAPPEVKFNVKLGLPDGLIIGKPVFSAHQWSYHKEENAQIFCQHNDSQLLYQEATMLVLNQNETSGDLYLDYGSEDSEKKQTLLVPPYGLDEVLAVQLLSLGRGVMLHSCGVRTAQGTGLLFVGESGSGKSTTTELWQNTGLATIIGDERVTIRKHSSQFTLHATAWYGSGQVTIPGLAPLEYLFIINHANNNNARKLNPSEAARLLLAHIYFPYWDPSGIAFTLEFLENLCLSIPCYQLGFTPDQRAVDYVQWLISS